MPRRSKFLFFSIPDVFDINFSLSDPTFNRMQLFYGSIKGQSFIKGIFAVYKLVLPKIGKNLTYKYPKFDSPIVVVIDTNNQEAAMKSVMDRLPNKFIIGRQNICDHLPPRHKILSLGLRYAPALLWTFIKSKGYKKESMRKALDMYFVAFGEYRFYKKLLRKNKSNVKLSVLSNDHTHFHRSLIHAAKRTGISKTVYVQHASVSQHFPALSFDFSLLDGKDALIKYRNIAQNESKSFLVGVPKLDKQFSQKNDRDRKTIGVCSSTLDNQESIIELLDWIKEEYDVEYRPHPMERDTEAIAFANKHDIPISDSKTENSFDWLRKLAACIAGESNILLEAGYMKTAPLYYNFKMSSEFDFAIDNYGFLENNYIEKRIESLEELKVILTSGSLEHRGIAAYQKASFYNASLGTAFEGKSSEITSNLLLNLANGVINAETWKQRSVQGIKVYENQGKFG